MRKAAFVVGMPLLLAAVELFHRHPGDLLSVDVKTWLAVHYAQIFLFPLSALALVMLVHDRTGIAAGICRVAMFVFAVSYVALTQPPAWSRAFSSMPPKALEMKKRGVVPSMPFGLIRSWVGRLSSGRPFLPCSARLPCQPERLPARLHSDGAAVRGGRQACWRFPVSESAYSRHTLGLGGH
jgi:hypothetical protein